MEVDDITEARHYSIEEEKQKAEQDKMKESADSLKDDMRRRIEGLRGRFRGLLNSNDQLPADLKIPREVRRTGRTNFSRTKKNFFQSFVLDEDIRQNFQAELKDKADQSAKELAWESERCTIALQKLEQW